MTKIFRYRPVSDFTLDEIKENYLWFSRPTEFNDNDDSNLIGFAEKNENIKDAFNRVFKDYVEVGEKVSYSGVCCFTENEPETIDWRIFPKGHNGIFVEYNKDLIEHEILNRYLVGDCFKPVEYLDNPLVFRSFDKQGYDVLWEKIGNVEIYKSLRGDIQRSEKMMEMFLIKIFTRLKVKFTNQKELRIILGKKHFKDVSSEVKGYKVGLLSNPISCIYYNDFTNKDFVNNLNKITHKNIPLIKIDEK